MQIKPSISTYLDTRRKKKSGKYPLKLIITIRGKQHPIALGFDMDEEEYMIAISPEALKRQHKLKKHYEQLNRKINSEILKAKNIADQLPVFTIELFKRKFSSTTVVTDDISELYHKKIKQLIAEGRTGTAENYMQSLQSLQSFNHKLTISDITVEFLRSYERWFLEKGRSETTVGIYLRPLRHILNTAISINRFWDEIYPFGKGKYQIPEPRNVKKALPTHILKALFEYTPPPGTRREKAVDLFKFIYLGNGLNPKDLALLKFENIEGDYVKFFRAKTLNTTRRSYPIVFYLRDDMKDIIKKWGDTAENSKYIFKTINDYMSDSQKDAAIHQFIKTINKGLAEAASDLGYNGRITTMTARHSFATFLKRKGLPIAFISDSIGHTSLKTTQYYLDSFEDETREKASRMLTEFD